MTYYEECKDGVGQTARSTLTWETEAWREIKCLVALGSRTGESEIMGRNSVSTFVYRRGDLLSVPMGSFHGGKFLDKDEETQKDDSLWLRLWVKWSFSEDPSPPPPEGTRLPSVSLF